MIYGLLGMLAAFMLLVLVALFAKRRIDPKIAAALEPGLAQAGFMPLERSDPRYAQVEQAMRETGTIGFLERLYQRPRDGALLGWTLDSEDTNHHILGILRPSRPSGPWMLVLPPSLGGMGDKLVSGMLHLSLQPTGFVATRPAWLAALGPQALLLTQADAPAPHFSQETLERLASLGPLILRSNGSLLLLERISPLPEDIQREAQAVMRLRDELAGAL